MPYNPKKNGAANYKSWMQLTSAQISAIEALEGADNTSDPNSERFAQMVYLVNGISIDPGDISIGAVELKDSDSDIRATIVDAGLVTAIYAGLVDSNGNLLEDIKSYGSYDTTSYQNLDGTSASDQSTEFVSDTLVRVKAYSADCWVEIGANPTAVDSQGMLMTQYDEISMLIPAGNKIAVIGGKLNIVEIS